MLLLGYSFLYKEYNLTRFNHQKNATHLGFCSGGLEVGGPAKEAEP